MALTDKHKRFADEYLIDLNASAAYLRAGYTSKNPDVDGYKLLVNPSIQEYIRKRMKDREKRTEITQDRVLQEYAKLGFSNITDYLRVKTGEQLVKYDNGDGVEYSKEMIQNVVLYDTEEVDPVKMHAVAEIKQTKDGIALKLHDKKGALDSIARHLGMFQDNLNVKGDLNIVINRKRMNADGRGDD
jgi:phage terminase small subunit